MYSSGEEKHRIANTASCIGTNQFYGQDVRTMPTISALQGMGDTVFSFSKSHIFMREVLDAWVYDVCCTSTPFRNSFAARIRICTSESAATIRASCVPTINRQRANEAFNLFMRTSRFPKQDEQALFSSTTCEKAMSCGSKRLDGTIMDCTPVDILGDLPNFD